MGPNSAGGLSFSGNLDADGFEGCWNQRGKLRRGRGEGGQHNFLQFQAQSSILHWTAATKHPPRMDLSHWDSASRQATVKRPPTAPISSAAARRRRSPFGGFSSKLKLQRSGCSNQDKEKSPCHGPKSFIWTWSRGNGKHTCILGYHRKVVSLISSSGVETTAEANNLSSGQPPSLHRRQVQSIGSQSRRLL